jgi:Rod binding domain-containing protein
MSLPIVDQAALPAEVRNGTDKQKQAYAAALGFERMLVSQLTKSLAQDAMPGGDDSGSDDTGSGDSGSGDSGSAMYSDMVASSLADGIAQQGGLGLAQQLYRSLGVDR